MPGILKIIPRCVPSIALSGEAEALHSRRSCSYSAGKKVLLSSNSNTRISQDIYSLARRKIGKIGKIGEIGEIVGVIPAYDSANFIPNFRGIFGCRGTR
jgi:hypothetical protein